MVPELTIWITLMILFGSIQVGSDIRGRNGLIAPRADRID
jgi:hypothetical protein